MESKRVDNTAGLIGSRSLVEGVAGQWTMPGLTANICQGKDLSMGRMLKAQQAP